MNATLLLKVYWIIWNPLVTSQSAFWLLESQNAFPSLANPEKSSVPVSIPMMSLFTGWEKRLDHFMSDAFFGATEADLVNFSSTSVKVTGTDTAIITGDLTLNDITKSVDLNAVLHATGFNSRRETDWAGFTATTTLLRSDFGLGLGAPSVSDKVDVQISIEAGATN